ncbi:unnamed protein product [Effrenium voratum]|nr:unnamed protein product [Effrenium voratum]
MQSDFEAREASMREGECSAREALMKMQSDFEVRMFEAREASMREGECSAREASMREGECSVSENACAECVVLREKLRGAQDEARKASARAAAASKAWGR